MSYKKFLGAASAALMIVIAFTLVLAPAADAASKYKVLHAFNGKDELAPLSRPDLRYGREPLRLDRAGWRVWPGDGFQADPERRRSWTESVLHTFNGSDGQLPIPA